MHHHPTFIALVAALTLVACHHAAPRGRVMVLGLDGMDPVTLDQLMAEGKMPSFARLREGGAYGPGWKVMKPLLSPIIWTTIATGKRSKTEIPMISCFPGAAAVRRRGQRAWVSRRCVSTGGSPPSPGKNRRGRRSPGAPEHRVRSRAGHAGEK